MLGVTAIFAVKLIQKDGRTDGQTEIRISVSFGNSTNKRLPQMLPCVNIASHNKRRAFRPKASGLASSIEVKYTEFSICGFLKNTFQDSSVHHTTPQLRVL